MEKISKPNKHQGSVFRSLVNSSFIDVLGALFIVGLCLIRDFQGTYFYQGEIEFGVSIDQLFSKMKMGAYPLGIISIVGACFSLLSTRFIGKQRNSGNAIGIFTSIISGVHDFLFGNRSAIITYPISLVLNTASFTKWSQGVKIRDKDRLYYIAVILGMILGFALVYLGAYLFGGKTDHSFLIVVSITFGLSIGANFANIFKYEETWLSWMIYNVVQLIKNIMLLNIANVGKYIFYMANATITWLDWKMNGDN